jgi:hypothetical protein
MRSRPSSRRRDLAPGGWCREALEPLISLSLAGYGSRFVSEEFRTVDEHSVQNHGELAGDRHLGFAHAGTSGHAHPPALQNRAFDRPGQNDVGGLVEGGAHPAVTDLGNAPVMSVSPD